MAVRRQTLLRFSLGCVALSLIVATGCSRSETIPMSGTVSLKGEPLDTGTLVLTPLEASGGPSTGAGIANGRYDISALRGPRRNQKYRVEISSIETPKNAKPPAPAADDLLGGLKAPTGEQRVFADRIPAIYNRDSKLEITIPGEVERFEHDFLLK